MGNKKNLVYVQNTWVFHKTLAYAWLNGGSFWDNCSELGFGSFRSYSILNSTLKPSTGTGSIGPVSVFLFEMLPVVGLRMESWATAKITDLKLRATLISKGPFRYETLKAFGVSYVYHPVAEAHPKTLQVILKFYIIWMWKIPIFQATLVSIC